MCCVFRFGLTDATSLVGWFWVGLIVAVWWCGLLCCFNMSCRFVVVDLMCGAVVCCLY